MLSPAVSGSIWTQIAKAQETARDAGSTHMLNSSLLPSTLMGFKNASDSECGMMVTRHDRCIPYRHIRATVDKGETMESIRARQDDNRLNNSGHAGILLCLTS